MTTVARFEVPRVSPSTASAELRRISARYGLHAPTGNPVGNTETREIFSQRMEVFIKKNLILTKGLPITRRSIEVILREKRSPISRDTKVPLNTINELVLVWALDLIRLGYRGFTRVEVLDELKQEVLWLFDRYGHSLFEKHTLFCPFINIWKDQKLWQIMQVNDTPDDSRPPDLSVICQVPTCGPCIAEHKASK